MVWLKRIAVLLLVLAAVIIGGGLLLPDRAHVERSIVINVPQSQVFTMVNGFERFNEWSPWAKLDPNTRYEFKGPSQGVGAFMSWTSQDAGVGSGSQEIIESTPPTLVRVKLLFEGQDGAVSFHRLEPMETGTKVTWGFDAEFGNDLIGRWFGYLMFDSMLGADYEAGLANLKTVLEQAASAPANDATPPVLPAAPSETAADAPAQATG
ncbi:MAG: SRPBCC family protein [Pseudomonadota bacterium]